MHLLMLICSLSTLDLHVGDITGCLCTPQKANIGMYNGCDYPYKSHFLALPSLLHPSILFTCFYTCFFFYFMHINAILQGLLIQLNS